MTDIYRRRQPPPDWPKPISIVTREIDISSGLLQTPYCPRSLVTSEFYISGTEPTRDCDKHLAYGTPGLTPIDTFSTIPPPAAGVQPPIRVTPPKIQPGYEPVPSANQPRRPTVFDTTRRAPVSRDTTRRDTLRRDSTARRDSIPSAVRPPR
jgi:hypothetical protein